MNIWDFAEHLTPNVEEEFRLTIEEGHTKCDAHLEFAKSIELVNLHLKRDDQNPTGSHKDRSLAFQISAYLQQGKREFVISSSGNAAISAAAYCKKADVKLHIFISPNIPASKLERLQSAVGHDFLKDYESLCEGDVCEVGSFDIHIEARPKSKAFKFAKENDLIFLRGSTDDLAVEGFKTIAFELFDQAEEADSIFIPCSSGTSTVGIYEGYLQMKKALPAEDAWKIPQVHVVQTTKVNTIAREFDKDFERTETSIAKAIVDRVGHRKEQVIHNIIDTDGFGWVVSDAQIEKGLEILKSLGVECSPEGGMVMAAIVEAKEKGWSFNSPVCLITGVGE